MPVRYVSPRAIRLAGAAALLATVSGISLAFYGLHRYTMGRFDDLEAHTGRSIDRAMGVELEKMYQKIAFAIDAQAQRQENPLGQTK